MGSLSSSSTLAAVQAQYDDNASYFADNSTAKCKLFIEACQILLRRVPASMSGDGSSVTERSIREELVDARSWLEAHDPDVRAGPSITLISHRYNDRGGHSGSGYTYRDGCS